MVLCLALTSCSDFLTEKKYTGASYDYYQTGEGFESAVVAAYQQLRICANNDNMAMIEDAGSDTWEEGGDGGSGLTGFDSYDNTINPSNSYIRNFWNNLYSGIAYTNTALGMIDQADITEATRKVRRGELLFLRAYYYYDLVIQFGDIPLVTEMVNYPKTDYLRVPQKNIWNLIISDLRTSYENLQWDDNGSQFGRVTKAAVGHMLSKMYLFRSSVDVSTEDRGQKTSDLDSCIFYGKEVINSGKHALESNFASVFDINNQKNKEIIFSVQYDNDYVLNNGTNSNTGNNLHMMYTMYAEQFAGVQRDLNTGRPWRRFRPTEHGLDIYDKLNDSRMYKTYVWMYSCNDPSNAPVWTAQYAPDPSMVGQKKFSEGDTAILVSFEKTGLSGQALTDYISTKPYHYVPWESYNRNHYPTLVKYLDPNRAAINTQGGGRDCIRMRLAETYLLVGEAYGRKGDFANAAEYINVVRERAAWKKGETKSAHYYLFDGGKYADLTKSTESNMLVNAATLSSVDFTDWMLDERGRELAGEINRCSDLKRCGTSVFLRRIRAYNTYAASNVTDKHRFLPIPQTHIDLVDPADPNPQNPGY